MFHPGFCGTGSVVVQSTKVDIGSLDEMTPEPL